MPLFEYRCTECRHQFETLVTAARQPACPVCHGQKLEKLLSVFAVSARSGDGRGEADTGPSACGTCGDPRGPGACQLE